MFKKYSLTKRFQIPDDILEHYLTSLEFHYNPNPYHNACLGADVLHSLLFFITNSDVHKFLTPTETMACIIAGLAHDVGHPGLTSRYLIQTRDPLAIQFNDISVLENMHCSIIFQFLAHPGQNIFENLDAEDWACARKVIIDMILATDMSKHFEILGKFRSRAVILSDLNLEKFDDKLLILSTAIKCADISHSAKSNILHQKWTKLVQEEFFKQGDLEKAKKLQVSMYCDRTTTNVAKSQSGFLRNICVPLFDVLTKYLNTEPVLQTFEELKKNIEFWESSLKSRKSTQPVIREFLLPLEIEDSVGGSMKGSISIQN